MSDFSLPVELSQLIKTEQAYHYRIIPTKKLGTSIVLKTDNSNISSLQSELTILLGFPTQLEVDTTENINKYLTTNYRKSASNTVSEIHYSNDFLEKYWLMQKK